MGSYSFRWIGFLALGMGLSAFYGDSTFAQSEGFRFVEALPGAGGAVYIMSEAPPAAGGARLVVERYAPSGQVTTIPIFAARSSASGYLHWSHGRSRWAFAVAPTDDSILISEVVEARRLVAREGGGESALHLRGFRKDGTQRTYFGTHSEVTLRLPSFGEAAGSSKVLSHLVRVQAGNKVTVAAMRTKEIPSHATGSQGKTAVIQLVQIVNGKLTANAGAFTFNLRIPDFKNGHLSDLAFDSEGNIYLSGSYEERATDEPRNSSAEFEENRHRIGFVISLKPTGKLNTAFGRDGIWNARLPVSQWPGEAFPRLEVILTEGFRSAVVIQEGAREGLLLNFGRPIQVMPENRSQSIFDVGQLPTESAFDESYVLARASQLRPVIFPSFDPLSWNRNRRGELMLMQKSPHSISAVSLARVHINSSEAQETLAWQAPSLKLSCPQVAKALGAPPPTLSIRAP